MLESIVNPVVRRAFRPWPALLFTTASLLIGLRGRTPAILTIPFGVAGAFCLSYGLPRAALRVIEWDRSGRLDQLRLAGWTPARLMASMLLGGAAPWLLSGAAIVGFWAVTESAGPILLRGVLPLALAGWIMALVALALPRGQALDPRIAATALSLVALFASAAAIGVASDQLILGPRVAGSFNSLWELLVVAALLVTPICLPRVIALGSRPAAHSVTSAQPFGWVFRLPVSPLVLRGVRQGTLPCLVLTAAAMTGIGLLARIEVTQPNNIAVVGWFLSISPIVVGAIAISVSCRGDLHAGRFDIERTAAKPAALNMLSIVLGAWAPYLLSWSVMYGTVVWLWNEPLRRLGYSELLDLTPIAIAMMAPLALIEGWNGGWLGSFSAAAFLAFPVCIQAGLPGVMLAGWIPWAIAAQTIGAGPGVIRNRALAFAMAAVAAATLALTVDSHWSPYFPTGGRVALGELLPVVIATYILYLACVESLSDRFFANTRFRLTASAIAFSVIALLLNFRTSLIVLPMLVGTSAVFAMWAGRAIRVAIGRDVYQSQLINGLLAVLVPILLNWAMPNPIFDRGPGRPQRLTDWDIELFYRRQFLAAIGLLLGIAAVALITRAIWNKFRRNALAH